MNERWELSVTDYRKPIILVIRSRMHLYHDANYLYFQYDGRIVNASTDEHNQEDFGFPQQSK